MAVRIDEEILLALQEEQLRLRKATGKKPPMRQLLRELWNCYARMRGLPVQIESQATG